MSLTVRSRLKAQRDVIRIANRLAREASPRVAERFLAALDQTFRRLAKSPQTGTRVEVDEPSLADLRCTSLATRFKNYLVFYLVLPDLIEVVRVLHGAQDLPGILADEVEEPETDDPPP